MLNLLQIENIAVIEQAEITFDRGLNVLTGETGAGKSIVIDSISAILGARTYRDLIRTGCDRAAVSAVFSGITDQHWFSANDVPFSEELLIRRELFADGRNVCRVNGQIVSVSLLRDLGKSLISIHGQNDTQTLFDEQTHVDYLDALAPDSSYLEEYQRRYGEYRKCADAVKQLSMDAGARMRRIETLQNEIREIEGASVREGEDEELESRKRILINAEKVSNGLSSALDALYGDENGSGASDLLSAAERELTRLVSVDDSFSEQAEQLAQLRIAMDNVTNELRSRMDDLAFSADELETIEDRLALLKKLKVKYGPSLADVQTYLEKVNAELRTLDCSDERLEQMKADLVIAEQEAREAAKRLHDERLSTSIQLKEKLEAELSQLAMPSFRFETQFEDTDLQENGADNVRFLMSANVGESLKPLSKIASGGELARIMLALEGVLSEKGHIPTMIFDEVDAGVSGRAAQKVAEKLLDTANGKQVLCVTHLAQIAAMADCHMLISKKVQDGRTFTSVKRLSRDERVDELARIIGGADITQITKDSAEEMLRCKE